VDLLVRSNDYSWISDLFYLFQYNIEFFIEMKVIEVGDIRWTCPLPSNRCFALFILLEQNGVQW